MPRTTLKVKSNDALVSLSERNPEIRFDVLGAWPTDGNLRVLVETARMELGALQETLSNTPGITDVAVRHATERSVLFELNTPSPNPHGAMAQSGIVPAFPLRLEGGWFVDDLTATRDQLSSFREELESADIEYRLIQVSETDETRNLLSDRQEEVLEVAVERGYYDSPRKCSLSDIAERLEVNKSVVSRVLHRAEGQIITTYCSQ